jgi:hypothetical protein
MTSRSSTLFWGLIAVLAVVIVLAAGAIGFRTWQVEDARKSLSACGADVGFRYEGPKWLQSELPRVISQAWCSSAYVSYPQARLSGSTRVNRRHLRDMLPELHRLPRLVGLELWRADVDKPSIGSLAAFPRLTQLSVRRCQLADDELESLIGLKQLTALNLSNNPITDAGLEHLSGLINLHDLTLDHTHVTEHGLIHLRPLTNLTNLSIVNTGIPESALTSLEADIPGLMISDD